ncbi:hypothetical protein [Rudaea sp. 3F27F6]|uniref:hypothetical protein n=1 Tax=Rudaea sp. 3F27F6 TaxID=2502208 RepID=UPI0010F6BB6A|nr:hypothetical protein [Rudaea sp. 3F27F6]
MRPGSPIQSGDQKEPAGWEDEGLPPPISTDGRDRLRASLERRDSLLHSETWLSSDEVAIRISASIAGNDQEQDIRWLRREGRLFAVRFKGRYLHPDFQFNAQGQLMAEVKDLLDVLPRTDANWNLAFWVFQPTRALGGKRPADVFRQDPQRVVVVAQKDFLGDNERW